MKLAITIGMTVLGVLFIALVAALLWFWSGLAWLKSTLDRQIAMGGAR